MISKLLADDDVFGIWIADAARKVNYLLYVGLKILSGRENMEK